MFTQTWYVDVDPQLRMERLVRRHVAAGKPPEYALTWANGPDERNAALIRTTRTRADDVVLMN